MTDQIDRPSGQPLPPPSPDEVRPTRLDRLRGELVAGGAVEEADDDALVGGWRAAVAISVIVALFAALAVRNVWWFVFVVGVVVSIFLHELGHFLAARWSGMKATQFFLFFGPRLWSFRRGETEYGVRALPLGAFVRIIGMHRIDDVDPADEARTYRQQSFPKRMLTISAGSLMHIAIAVVLLFVVYLGQGERTEESVPEVYVSALSADMPAARAGIRPDDRIVSIGGIAVDDPNELGDVVREFAPTDVVDVVVIRDGEEMTVPVALAARPGLSTDDPLYGTAFLGVSPYSPIVYQQHGVGGAAVNAVTDVFPTAWQSAQGVVKVLNPVNVFTHLNGTNDDLSSRPTTLVQVTAISDDVGDAEGIWGLLWLLAVLNVFVGVFNMFPLLPLDGGHAAVAVYERVQEARRGTRQRYFADVDRLMPFAMGVMALLLTLMMAGLYLDITQPL